MKNPINKNHDFISLLSSPTHPASRIAPSSGRAAAPPCSARGGEPRRSVNGTVSWRWAEVRVGCVTTASSVARATAAVERGRRGIGCECGERVCRAVLKFHARPPQPRRQQPLETRTSVATRRRAQLVSRNKAGLLPRAPRRQNNEFRCGRVVRGASLPSRLQGTPTSTPAVLLSLELSLVFFILQTQTQKPPPQQSI